MLKADIARMKQNRACTSPGPSVASRQQGMNNKGSAAISGNNGEYRAQVNTVTSSLSLLARSFQSEQRREDNAGDQSDGEEPTSGTSVDTVNSTSIRLSLFIWFQWEKRFVIVS